MTKLWDKGYTPNEEIDKFTVGDDYLLDMNLIKWDCIGSIAHAAMLKKIKILSDPEFSKLKFALKQIINDPKFKITPKDEDVHTAIENHLTSKLGFLGKKIHTCRSRNDQVLVDTRLFSKDKLLLIKNYVLELVSTLVTFAEKNKDVPIPGYTHTQKAMPSSVGLWSSAYAESLIDDLKVLDCAYSLNDQCPLGSAAGYGVSFDIDRKLVASLLGFSKVQNNVSYVQNSRGKIESVILSALTQIMLTLGKLASDLIWFSTPEFGYFCLPKEFCSGSSIMPQKVNPDVLELTRGKVSVMEGYLFQVQGIVKGLISGYSRDLQLTKEPLIKGLELCENTVKIMNLVVSGVCVNNDICIKACTPELFATDYALEFVKSGMAFRDAYKQVGMNLDKLKSYNPVEVIKSRKHIGSTGNLGLDSIKSEIKKEKMLLDKEKVKFDGTLKLILN